MAHYALIFFFPQAGWSYTIYFENIKANTAENIKDKKQKKKCNTVHGIAESFNIEKDILKRDSSFFFKVKRMIKNCFL